MYRCAQQKLQLNFNLDRSKWPNIVQNGQVMRKPTITDVAARAGVSKSTVSLVLQSSPLVKQATRAVVQRAMSEIGYVYNAAAAGLRTGRGPADLLAPSPASETPAMVHLCCDLKSADDTAFAGALQSACAAQNMGLRLLHPGEEWQGRRISTDPSHAADARTLTALHTRAKLRHLDGLVAGQAARHLLGLGATTIAFVGGDQHRDNDALRLRGYLQRLAKAEVAPLPALGGDDFTFGRRAGTALLAQHPACTAALCINDQVALGLIETLAERGIVIGEAFRVVGWGDTPAGRAMNLSSVQPNWSALAEAALTWAQLGVEAKLEVTPTLIRRASSTGGA